MAEAAGAAVRLIGDPAQHGAVTAGGMFRVLCERHPTDTPELADAAASNTPATGPPPKPSARADVADALDPARTTPATSTSSTTTRRRLPATCSNGGGTPTKPATTTPWSTAATPSAASSTASPTDSSRPPANSAPRRSNPPTGPTLLRRRPASSPAPATGRSTRPATRRTTSATAPIGTVTELRHAVPTRRPTCIIVDFDGLGDIELPRSFFDVHTDRRPGRGRHRPRLRRHQLRRPRSHLRRIHQPHRRRRQPARDLRRHHPRPRRQPSLAHPPR